LEPRFEAAVVGLDLVVGVPVGAMPGGRQQAQAMVAGVLAWVLLLFPTGRPPSLRWWVVGWATAAGIVLYWVGKGLGPIGYEPFPGVHNPFGVAGLTTVLKWVVGAAGLIEAMGFLGAFASLFVRFGRARGLERQQLKWFVYAAVLGLVIVFVPNLLPGDTSSTISTMTWALIPASLSAAVAVAVLRYRLYDIDRLINRTLVYSLVTVLLGAVYAGVVLLLGQLFGGVAGGPPAWAVAGATLAVAALFQPARRRIQAIVDRRFNRRRYDAAKTVEAFSARLRDEVDLDTLSAELLTVVDQTMQPTTASLWLRPSGRQLGRTGT
jgi:hypothetical protein